MIRPAVVMAVGGVLLLVGPRGSGAEPAPGKQVASLVRVKSTAASPQPDTDLGYLLFLPSGYRRGTDTWPLLLFLHGAGERGSDLELVKKHGPPRNVESQPDLPFVVVSPQCPRELRSWNVEHLTQLLDHVVANFRIDTRRVYVTGLSMGGRGTWSLIAAHPERFAAAVPICGRGNPSDAGRIKSVPLWVFHGARDEGVPLERSEEMVQAVQAAGGTVRFTVYPDAGHDSWTESYNNGQLYEWLLSQRLKGS